MPPSGTSATTPMASRAALRSRATAANTAAAGPTDGGGASLVDGGLSTVVGSAKGALVLLPLLLFLPWLLSPLQSVEDERGWPIVTLGVSLSGQSRLPIRGPSLEPNPTPSLPTDEDGDKVVGVNPPSLGPSLSSKCGEVVTARRARSAAATVVVVEEGSSWAGS